MRAMTIRAFATGSAVLAVLAVSATAAHAGPFDHGAAPLTTAHHLNAPWAQALFAAQTALSERFTAALVALRDAKSPGPILAALAVSLAYGCLHAAGPGHGKALVSGYFVSREATLSHVVLLASQIAAMHVASAGVLVIVLGVFVRSAFASPEDMRGVQAASDVLIVGIGVLLFRRALRTTHHHDAHAACDCVARATSPRTGWLTALGAGVVPCTGTMITLVFALGNGILLAGIGMLLAIAVGMSCTLIAIALAARASRRAVTGSRAHPRGRRAQRVLDFGGPAFIVLSGGTLLFLTLAP
jgi:nickel/cobalt transporter (NicO) family protein